MLKLIVYGIVVLAIMGMLYAAYEYVVDKGRNEIRTQDAPFTTPCKKKKMTVQACADEWTNAVAYNITLQADVGRWRDAAANCSGETTKGGKLKEAADKEKLRRLAEAEPQIRNLKERNAALEAHMAEAAKTASTCEQRIANIDAALRDMGQQAIRFSLGFGEAPKQPSKSGVRVTP